MHNRPRLILLTGAAATLAGLSSTAAEAAHGQPSGIGAICAHQIAASPARVAALNSVTRVLHVRVGQRFAVTSSRGTTTLLPLTSNNRDARRTCQITGPGWSRAMFVATHPGTTIISTSNGSVRPALTSHTEAGYPVLGFAAKILISN